MYCCGRLYCLSLLLSINCLRFDRGVVCIVVVGLSLLFMTILSIITVCIVVVGYIVYHYCLRFDQEVVCIVVVGYIVYHYCLRFDRGVVCIVVVGYIVYHYC